MNCINEMNMLVEMADHLTIREVEALAASIMANAWGGRYSMSEIGYMGAMRLEAIERAMKPKPL